MAADADPKVAPGTVEAPRERAPKRFPAPQLRLHDRKVYVGFGPTPLGEDLAIADLALTVPDVTFPFDIAGSAATRYQRKRCQFGYLDLEIGHELFQRAARRVAQSCSEHVLGLRLHLRPALFEGEGFLHGPQGPVPFTFRVGFQPEGSGVLACVFDVRLFGASPLPAPFAAALLARGAVRANAVPEATAFGAIGLAFDPVAGLVRRAVPLRGFRVPDCSDARLERVEPGPRAFHLHFAAAARPELPLDSELLTVVEGTRAFAEGEALLAQGDLAAAEAYYLRHGEAPDAHPFARERLLGLLAARPDAHDLALDLAQDLRRARPGAAAAYWAEAGIRLARGQGREAGDLLLALGRLARQRGEEAGAFHAFAAGGRALVDPAPGLASRAFQDALALRPDDLDSLQALALAADRAADTEGALRAYRRLTALARDPAQAARAHVRLGELLARVARDLPAARLHYDAALRRVPAEPDALVGLARLCRADGEHLRAVKLYDELRAEASRRADAELEARACLEAGATWDEGLGHTANALLRFQEAERLSPRAFEPSLRLGTLLERLGRPAEAAEALQRAAVHAESHLGRARDPEARAAGLRAHHALARLSADRLGDPAAARRHLEAVLALDPDDPVALRALLPAFRAEGRSEALARACERCAATVAESSARADLLAEAGELHLDPLEDPARASALLEQALLADPGCPRALEATARLAQARGEGPRLCRALLRLVEAATEPAAKAELLRRLAAGARDVAVDLDLAADALRRALVLEPGRLADLEALAAVERRRGDEAALAAALGDWARALESDGRFAQVAAVLRELAGVLDGRLGRTPEALALLEKAVSLAPEDRGALSDLAHLSLRAGRPAAAREAFRALLAHLPEGARPEDAARLQQALGVACQALGDREGALKALGAAFAVLPGDDDLGDRLDALLADAGRELERAAALAVRARTQRAAGRPGAAAALFASAARLTAACGDAPAAREAWASALEADPDGPSAPEALDALSQAALDAHDLPRAAELLARRARFDAQGRAAARRLYRAAALLKEARPDRFRDLLAAALERDADYPPARATLAFQAMADRDPARALAHVRVALADLQDPDALEPADRTALQRLGARAALVLGEAQAARELLRAYVAATPDDDAALGELAGLLRDEGAVAELVGVLEQLARLQRGTPALASLRERAGLLLSLSRRPEALACWREALALDPDDQASLEGLVRALPPADATERLSLLRRLAGLAPAAERRAALLVECGDVLVGLDRAGEAAQDFEAASQLASDPAPALDRLVAAARAADEEVLEVEALARRAHLAADRGERDAPERLLAAGTRLSLLAMAPEARRAVARAAGLAPPAEPSRHEALAMLADLHEAAGEREELVLVLGRLAELQRGSVRCGTLLRQAAHLGALGRRDEARAALDAALAASPGDRRGLLAARDLCQQVRDDAMLVMVLEALLCLPLPDRRIAAGQASELADAWLRVGDPTRAEAALRRTLAFDRGYPRAEERLLQLLLLRGEVAEALPLGERLARAMPDEAAAERLLDLSWRAGRELQDAGAALRCARLAAERAPQDPAVQRRLGRLLYLAGAGPEALEFARACARAADFEAEPEQAREALLRLADLSLEAGDLALGAEVLRGLLERCPTDAAAADRLYEALLPQDPAGAVAALARHARALTPGSRSRVVFLRLAEDSRRLLGAPRAAAEFLELAQAVGGDDTDLEVLRLEVLREAGDLEGLAESLRVMAERAVAARDPERALVALDELAAVLADRDALGAVSALGQAVALLSDSGRSAEAARRLVAQGTLLRDAVGDEVNAERALRRAFELDPGEVSAARAAAALCRRRGDAAGEAGLVEALLPALSPEEQVPARVELARLRASLGEAGAAVVALEDVLRAEPRHEAARELYEAVLRAEGRLAELARSLEARAAFAAEGTSRAAWLRRAADLYLGPLGDGESAARVLQAACRALPGDLDLAEACAAALAALGRGDEAAPLDAAVVAADPTREGAFLRCAARLREDGDLGALALLLEARADRLPEAERTARAGHLVEAGTLRERLGDAEGAARDEERAFELDPASGRAFAAVMARAGADVEHLAALLVRRARAVPAEALELHRSRGQMLAGAGLAAAAAGALDEALALDPRDPESLALRGDVAEALAGDAGAAPFDERLLAGGGRPVPQQSLARAHYRLGFLALSRADAAAAQEHLGVAYALDPLHPRGLTALSALADGYARAGDRAMHYRVRMALAARSPEPAEREASLSAAADCAPDVASEAAALAPLSELRPDDSQLLERLGLAYARLNRTSPAAAALERAAAAEPSGPRRSRLLLAASGLLDLHDAAAARAMRLDAWRADPANLEAARAALPLLRGESGFEGLRDALAVIAAVSPDVAEAAAARLEWAGLMELGGEAAAAADACLELVRRGPGPCFAEAAARAHPLLASLGRNAEAAEALAASARTLDDRRLRAERLAEAAFLLEREAHDPTGAAGLLAEAAAADPDSPRPLAALAALRERQGDVEGRARALEQEAGRLPGELRAERLREVGEAWAAAGEPARSLAAFEAATEAAPGRTDLRLALADACEAQGALDRALAHVLRVAAAAEGGPRRLLLKRAARLAREAGRTTEAFRIQRVVFDLDPADAEAFEALLAAPALLDPAVRAEALDRRERALEPLGEPARAERLALLHERALLCAGPLGAVAEAERSWRRALELDRLHRPALAGLRELARVQQDLPGLLGLLEAEVEASPPGAERYAALLELAGSAGSAEPFVAQDAWERALAEAPAAAADPAAVELALARSLASTRTRPVRALELLERALLRDPGDVALRELAAAAAEEAGDRETARRHLRLGLETAPDHPGFAQRLESLGAGSPADRAWLAGFWARRAAEPSRAAHLHLQAARDLREAGDGEGEVVELEAALVCEPSSQPAFERLLQLRADDPAGLRALLERRVEVVPEDLPGLARRLGALRLSAGDAADAAQAFGAAVLHDPTDEAALRGLAEARVEAGLWDAKELAQALSQVAPRAVPQVARGVAQALEASGRQEEALAHWALAAGHAAEPAPDLAGVARAAQALGRPEAALAACERLLQGLPRDARAAQVHLTASEWCAALGRSEEARQHLEVAVLQGAGGAAALKRLAEQYEAEGTWPEAAATFTWFAGQTEDPAERAAAWRRAVELYAERVGDPAQAAAMAERALQDEPDAADLLLRVVELEVEAGAPARVLRACERVGAVLGAPALAPFRLPFARALQASGRGAEAVALLKEELVERFDEEVGAELRDLAEALGDRETAVAVETALVDQLPAKRAREGSQRLRALAARLEADEPSRAADLLVQASRLSPLPGDLEREAGLRERGGDLVGAAAPLLRLARATPVETRWLRELARVLEVSGAAERASAVQSLLRFEDPSHRFPSAAIVRARVDGSLRSRLYEPLALGPVAQLLRALGPTLGAAFPADLSGRGVGDSDRVGALHAPALAARVREARDAVGLPALEAFLSSSGGVEVALEPADPDALVVGLGALTELEPGALSFLLVRAAELSLAGHALAAQAGPDGLEGLVRCALSAAGLPVAVPEPFDAMVEATAEQLQLHAPAGLEALLRAASSALAELEPVLLLDALERSAARVALVVCGDPGAALRALAGPGDDLAAAAERDPLVADLLAHVLRDDWEALRRAVLGSGT